MRSGISHACLAGALAVGGDLQAQDPMQTPLAIRRIVLYKHGVGYFERQGAVQGSAVVPLSFRAAEMKDVLKSLFAVDLSGGRIAAIDYDSKDPIEKQLEDILFRVPEGNALTKFLTQLKGAAVRVTIGARQVGGRVLGIEPVTKRDGDVVTQSHRLVLLRDDGTIESVDLLEVAGIEVLDEAVRQGLDRMMNIYARARYADRKVVQLRCEGEGERQVRVGYVIETPIWKTTYRLLLGEAAPLLQGWAIAENRTDDDWRDVQLTFVAGSPLSFILDLYTSYYPRRPEIRFGLGQPETEVAAAPPQEKRRGRVAAAQEMAAADAPAMAAGAPEPSLDMGELMERSVVPVAQGQAVGALFAYAAKGPVTIAQGQAAMVPILSERMAESKKVLHYRRDQSPHPLHAVQLRNATALTLEKGPVTVFEAGTCLGEAMLSRTLEPGMNEVVAYAVEAGVEVEARGTSTSRPVIRGVLVNGVLTLVHVEQLETSYALRNKTGTAHALVLDHAKAGGPFKLREPAQPAEELPGHYRFTLDLGANAEHALLVREEHEVSTQVAVIAEPVERVRFYSRQPYLDEASRKLLEQVLKLMEERAALDARIANWSQEKASLARDQDEIRKNIAVLRDSPEERKLRDQYVARLGQAMARTDEINAGLRDAVRQREELEARIARELNAAR
jgi:hypothetical protein